MTIQATIHPSGGQTRILATLHGDDCLKATLPPSPLHRRALSTLLEGLSLWHATPVHAVLVVDDDFHRGRVEDLWDGGLWPPDLSNIHYEIAEPSRQTRLWGPGDFGEVYALHGGTR